MKIYLLLSILLIFKTALCGDPFWVRKESPTFCNLKNVSFLNSQTGWISGDSGLIARTTNSGNDWIIQNTSTVNDIQALHIINERSVWALAWNIFPDSGSFLGTLIFKTTNGGANWESYMYPDSNKFMKTIYFIDSLKGFMGGSPVSIVFTTDAGATWNKADTDTSLMFGFPVENLKFIDAKTGFACGGFRDIAGTMWKTSNGGLNWLVTIVGPEPLNDLYIANTSHAIATGGDFEYGSSIVKTSDQGLTWIYDTLGTFGVASGIDFRTSNEGWITLGIAQKFAYTLDSGKRWTNIYSPDSIPVFDVDFVDTLTGWAVGYYGSIFKYNVGVVNVNNNNEAFNPNDFILYQNYPNPFNPKTVIRYLLNKKDHVKLIIFDALGKEILTLVNSEQSVGEHIVSFNGTSIPSGIYFYELTTGTNYEVKKMLLLK